MPGKIITFYSYKGGTGRTMTLANVAWILASNGKRVLVIDWDLEAPGLHRYFQPFLTDMKLKRSAGLIDLILEYLDAVTNQPMHESESDEWIEEYTDILRYAISLRYSFPEGGCLDILPAGKQDEMYAIKINSFDWKDFFDRLGGSGFLELLRRNMRAEYDYILIDSRTGVSDTSGICTVMMPDDLVVCFTLNSQSIEGAASVAESVRKLRDKNSIRIFPVRSRVEFAEKEKLDRAREYANLRFARLLSHIPPYKQESYWGEVEVPYQPYYAYEEVLATIADKGVQTTSLLASMERITGFLTDHEINKSRDIDESERLAIIQSYTTRTALSILDSPFEEALEQVLTPSFAVPALPPSFVFRSVEINEIREFILNQKLQNRPMVLHGLAGIGKSTVASALCHDEAIIQKFTDGIYWLSPSDHREEILSQFSSLFDKAALLVMDDVSNIESIPSDIKIAPQCCILITTRDKRVGMELGAKLFHIPSFDSQQSAQFFLLVTGMQGTKIETLATMLGHHPLALKLTAIHLRNGTNPGTLLNDYAHLSELKVGPDPKTPETNLNISLSQSIDLLTKQNRALFYALGVFPECNSIPKTVVQRLWKRLDSTLTNTKCSAIMSEFMGLDLIQKGRDKNDISLSPLLYDYVVCTLADRITEMHRNILSAYNPFGQQWHEIKGDDYLSRNLPYHLLGAGQQSEPFNLLLWLQKTISSVGVHVVLNSYKQNTRSFTDQTDDSLMAIYGALRQSAHILTKDQTQLPYQLLGRLHDYKSEAIKTFTTQVRQSFDGIYFQPLTASLHEVTAYVCTLLGHDDEVICASFTNDARCALSGSKDTTIKIWDAQSWQEVRTLRGHTKAVKALCISTDDNYVITASEDKTIKIWEIESGREVASWIAHKEAVNSVAITSRKPWIISASNDGTVKIWEYSVAEPAKQRILYSSSIHPISVNKIAVSPDEKSLFVACGDGSLRILDISKLESLDDASLLSLSLQSKNQHSRAVNDIAIARDGKYMLSASSDNLLKIWDIENKNEIRTIRGHTNAVKAAKWLPKVQTSETQVQNPDKRGQHEEHVISSSGMGQLRVWDAGTGHSRLILKAHTSGVNDLAIEGKSRILITASSDKSLKVWNINDLFEPSPFIGHKEAVTSVKISPDGRLVVSVSGDGIVRVWNIAEPKKLTEWLAHDDQISDIALTADGKKLLTSSWDKRLRLWDVETGRRIRSWEHNPLALSHVTITQDQKEIVYAYTNGEIGIVSLVSNDRPFSFLPHRVQLSALLVSPDGKKIIAAYADQTILKWDRASGTCDWSVSMTNGAATSMILTPNGSLLFIGEDDGSISILRTETGDKLRQWGKKHEQAVSGLSLSGSKYLISSSIDQTIRVWDIQGQKQLTKFDIGASLQCSTMSSDSRTIVAGDVLGRIHLLRLENAKL